MGGRPGVYSSRYAPTDPERIAKLLGELQNVADTDRTARFVCAAALIAAPNAPATLEIGTCEGQIGHTPRGDNGFGYDPVFEIPGRGQTLAQLDADQKNAISHRGNALEKMKPHLEALFAAR